MPQCLKERCISQYTIWRCSFEVCVGMATSVCMFCVCVRVCVFVFVRLHMLVCLFACFVSLVCVFALVFSCLCLRFWNVQTNARSHPELQIAIKLRRPARPSYARIFVFSHSLPLLVMQYHWVDKYWMDEGELDTYWMDTQWMDTYRLDTYWRDKYWYAWYDIRQQSSEKPCDETSFGKKWSTYGVWCVTCGATSICVKSHGEKNEN